MMTRRVHRFECGNSRWDAPKELQKKLNTELAPAERIVGVYEDQGYVTIITESLGLGPQPK